jgi:ribosomal protein L5
MKGRGQRQYIFNSLVSLRKNSLYNFLYFFIENVLLNLKENFLTINKLLAGDQYSFSIKDASIFPSIAELFIKWNFPLFFTFNLNISNNRYYFNLVLRNFSFYTIIINEAF